MLNYTLITSLAAVIEEGGFERAATRLHITQSAVSQRIKQLEEQFGRIVLLRTAPPQPTDFGARILRIYNQVSRLEDDFYEELAETEKQRFTVLPVGINADSLATWFPQAVRRFLQENDVVFDLMVDDQEETHRYLRDGRVLACISTRKTPMQGCSAHFLGHTDYHLCCTPEFRHRWFGAGLDLTAVEHAPLVTFNRSDRLNLSILERLLGERPNRYVSHYVPSSEVFCDFIVQGLAYGALPEHQAKELLQKGVICDLAPHQRERVALYCHHWNIDSSLLRRFTTALCKGFQERDGTRRRRDVPTVEENHFNIHKRKS